MQDWTIFSKYASNKSSVCHQTWAAPQQLTRQVPDWTQARSPPLPSPLWQPVLHKGNHQSSHQSKDQLTHGACKGSTKRSTNAQCAHSSLASGSKTTANFDQPMVFCQLCWPAILPEGHCHLVILGCTLLKWNYWGRRSPANLPALLLTFRTSLQTVKTQSWHQPHPKASELSSPLTLVNRVSWSVCWHCHSHSNANSMKPKNRNDVALPGSLSTESNAYSSKFILSFYLFLFLCSFCKAIGPWNSAHAAAKYIGSQMLLPSTDWRTIVMLDRCNIQAMFCTVYSAEHSPVCAAPYFVFLTCCTSVLWWALQYCITHRWDSQSIVLCNMLFKAHILLQDQIVWNLRTKTCHYGTP